MTIITSPRLTMRKWNNNPLNLKDMVRWLNDPEVVRYSEQRHKQHTEETQLAYLQDHPGVFREIYLEDRFIGTISAYIDRPNAVADVGILIGERSVWRQGLGFEAWEAFCDNLFKNKIRKIEAGCMANNHGMISIFRKYGMRSEGWRDEHFIYLGLPIDMVMAGKFA